MRMVLRVLAWPWSGRWNGQRVAVNLAGMAATAAAIAAYRALDGGTVLAVILTVLWWRVLGVLDGIEERWRDPYPDPFGLRSGRRAGARRATEDRDG